MDGTTVSAPHSIVNVAEGHIEWIIFVLTGSHRHSGLVAPKDEGNKHCPVRRGILGD